MAAELDTHYDRGSAKRAKFAPASEALHYLPLNTDRDRQVHRYAMKPSEMDLPGWNLHKLSGKFKGFSAVWVSGNFRIWFRMEDGDAFDVDYGDYH